MELEALGLFEALVGAGAAPAVAEEEGASRGFLPIVSCESDLMMEPRRAAWSPTVSSGLEVRRVLLVGRSAGLGAVPVPELGWGWGGRGVSFEECCGSCCVNPAVWYYLVLVALANFLMRSPSGLSLPVPVDLWLVLCCLRPAAPAQFLHALHARKVQAH